MTLDSCRPGPIMDDGTLPSGLPLEVENWLDAYLATEVFGARLERMRRLLQDEDFHARNSSNPSTDFSIPAYWGSVRIEGKGFHHSCQTEHSYSLRPGLQHDKHLYMPHACAHQLEPALVQASCRA